MASRQLSDLAVVELVPDVAEAMTEEAIDMWESLLIYSQLNSRWFEPVSGYSPTSELLTVYRDQIPGGWRLSRRGLWFISNPPSGELVQQGWKIHVSSDPDGAADVLDRAMRVLIAHDVPFKFMLDRYCVALTSGKRWPRGSSGKFITVYPRDDALFSTVVAELSTALAGSSGPYILTDRRAPESQNVFYRYGGFKALPQLQPDGTSMLMIEDPAGSLIPDERKPVYAKPDWVRDPFGEDETPSGVPELDNGRFLITGVLSYTNAGGVYRAQDRQSGLQVVLKEARPGVLVGLHEHDARTMLTKEYEILTELADCGHFARPIALFTEWEHLFMAEAFVDGEQMSQRSIKTNPAVTLALSGDRLTEYYCQQQRWWLSLLDAVQFAHGRNILLADLSFGNVLIRESDDELVLIDLETAVRLGLDQPVGLHTPGISSPLALRTGEIDFGNDFYSIGAIMLGSVMFVNGAVGLHPPLLAGFLDNLTADLNLPPELGAVITQLMGPAEIDPAAVRARIAAIDFAGHTDWARPVPLGLPATEADVLPADEATQIVHSACRQLQSTADTRRQDRLFPGHLLTFEANPYSVGYGAAGVLHALHVCGQPIDDRLVTWLLRADLTNSVEQLCPPGLYSGLAGIGWVLDELGHQQHAYRLLEAAMGHSLLAVEPGILNGIAGVGMANLRLARTAADPARAAGLTEWAVHCGQLLEKSAVLDDRGAHWTATARPGAAVPIGYGRGSSGVALFLLYLSAATGDPRWQQLGRLALDHDISHAYASDLGYHAFPATAPDPGEKPAVVRSYLDEGTAGIATALLRYLAVTGDDSLRRSWQDMRPDLCRKYAVLPQLFHGLAGIGMALLDAAELIGDRHAALEAGRLARGVSLYAVTHPEGIAFPGEQCMRESSDLASGTAGVLMFLNRLGDGAAGRYTNSNFVLDELLAIPGGHS